MGLETSKSLYQNTSESLSCVLPRPAAPARRGASHDMLQVMRTAANRPQTEAGIRKTFQRILAL